MSDSLHSDFSLGPATQLRERMLSSPNYIQSLNEEELQKTINGLTEDLQSHNYKERVAAGETLVKIAELPDAPIDQIIQAASDVLLYGSSLEKKAMAIKVLLQIAQLPDAPLDQRIQAARDALKYAASAEIKAAAVEVLLQMAQLPNATLDQRIKAASNALKYASSVESKAAAAEILLTLLENPNFVAQHQDQADTAATGLFDGLNENDPWYDRALGAIFAVQGFQEGHGPIAIYNKLKLQADAANAIDIAPLIQPYNVPGLEGESRPIKLNSDYLQVTMPIPETLPNANAEDLNTLIDAIEIWARDASEEDWVNVAVNKTKESALASIRAANKKKKDLNKFLSATTYSPTSYRAKAVVEYYKTKIEDGEPMEGRLCAALLNCIKCISGVKAGIDVEFRSLGLQDPVDTSRLQAVTPNGPVNLALTNPAPLDIEDQKAVRFALQEHIAKAENTYQKLLDSVDVANSDAEDRNKAMMAIIDRRGYVPEEKLSKATQAINLLASEFLNFTKNRREAAINGDGILMHQLLGLNADATISQPSHQHDYVLGEIGGAIGLRPKDKPPVYDKHGGAIADELTQTEAEPMLKAFFNLYTTESELKALSSYIFEKLADPEFSKAFTETMNLILFDPEKTAKDQVTLGKCIISTNNANQPYAPITQEALEVLKALRTALGEDAFYDLVDSDESAEANWPELAKQIQGELAPLGLRIQDFGLCDKLEDYIPTEAALAKLFYDFGLVK